MAPSTSKIRRRAVLASAYAGAGLVVVIACCALVLRNNQGGGRKQGVVLVVSGDTAGWITPCGCTVNQSGGLPRRGTYLAALARTHAVVYADVGGSVEGTSAYHALKTGAIFRGVQAMHIAAQNLGAAELALGASTLRQLQQSTGVPLVSANVVDAAGTPIAPAVRIVTAGPLRVALVGVVAPQYATADLRVQDPRQAILAAIASAKGQYDRLIVLAYVSENDLEALARDLPEADAVIGGPTGQNVKPHRLGGGALVGSATLKGKFLLEAALEDARPARLVELNGSFADAPDQLANVARFRDDLRKIDFPAASTGLAPAAARMGQFAGSQSCQSCHVQAFNVWTSMGHFKAGQVLVPQGSQGDPSCQVCHTTGYGAPGGFVSLAATPARLDVGCENCHGPSQAHVSDPQVRTPFLAKAQCITCHDQENSPNFVYNTYWARISHAGDVRASRIQQEAP